MTPDELTVDVYRDADEEAVVDLWHRAGLLVSWNDPRIDIRLKVQFQPSLFLVARIGGQIVGTVMAGYDGHRGWLNYLAVSPDVRRRGIGRALVHAAAKRLRHLGCPKINVQIRQTNLDVVAFYRHIGFSDDAVVGMGMRLNNDSH